MHVCAYVCVCVSDCISTVAIRATADGVVTKSIYTAQQQSGSKKMRPERIIIHYYDNVQARTYAESISIGTKDEYNEYTRPNRFVQHTFVSAECVPVICAANVAFGYVCHPN